MTYSQNVDDAGTQQAPPCAAFFSLARSQIPNHPGQTQGRTAAAAQLAVLLRVERLFDRQRGCRLRASSAVDEASREVGSLKTGSLTVPRSQEARNSGQLLCVDRRDEDKGDLSKASVQCQSLTATDEACLAHSLVGMPGFCCIRRNKVAMGRWPTLYCTCVRPPQTAST
jgi:hypothetical protein